MGDVSPDGRWLRAWAPLPGNAPPAQQVFPLDGGPPVPTGAIFSWSSDGRSMAIWGDTGAIVPESRTYLVPLPRGQALPRIPAGGLLPLRNEIPLPGARRIDESGVRPGPSLDVYAFYRGAAQRNLYRIAIQ